MNSVTDILNSFDSILLKEMDAVALQDRTDTKYVFHSDKLPELLKALMPKYRILDVNGVRLSDYESHYFDDDDNTFYNAHHNNHGQRYKVRYRKYVNSAISFFEIKKKINTNRTIKKRIPCDTIGDTISGTEKDFFEKLTHLDADKLHPKVQIDYSRITLVSKDLKERATFDLYLKFHIGDKESSFDKIVIAEVKQNSIDHSSPVIKQLKAMHINEASLSKYCMGIYHLYNNVKKNNFKPQVHYLNKILKQNKLWT